MNDQAPIQDLSLTAADALKRYGRHLRCCTKWCWQRSKAMAGDWSQRAHLGDEPACDCGFEDALREVGA